MKIILAILLALLAAPVAAQTMITKAAIDQGVILRIVDSVDGTPETGVVFNTAGIDLEYRRDGAASVDITEATLAALTTAHTDGGFLHIGNGYYRLDLPDAAVATGANKVLVHGTVTGMVVVGQVVQLTSFDLQDSQPDVNVNSMAGMAFGASPTVGPNFFTFFNSDDTVSGTFVHDFVDYFNTVSSINSTVGTMEPVLNDNYAVTNAIMADLFGIVNANILTIAEKLPSANAKMAGEGVTAQNLDQVSGGGAAVIPVNQVAVPEGRTWIVTRGPNGLIATVPIGMKVGETEVPFAIDFRNELANNGRLSDFNSIAIQSGAVGGVTFHADLDVDKVQAKGKITPITAGTYYLKATATKSAHDGGGQAIAIVRLIVTE